jgi:hypothetical protein
MTVSINTSGRDQIVRGDVVQGDKVVTQVVKRSRGGQVGNQNSLKHGFYSRQFRAAESDDLAQVVGARLTDEIALLRVATRRLMELATNSDVELETYAKALNVVGNNAMRISTLIQRQSYLTGSEQSTIGAEISEALRAAQVDLGLEG